MDNKVTPLFDMHLNLNAKMVNFNGWNMPLEYKGALSEHEYVRKKSGLFDTSHMGRISVTGNNAKDFLQYICTNNLDKLKKGKVLYTHACNQNGGILDDFMIYNLDDNYYFCIVNASNREKIFSWFNKHSSNFNVHLQDKSDDIGMISLQGPLAEKVISNFFNIQDLYYLEVKSIENTIISRTGYTGEDGFEVLQNNENIFKLWFNILKNFSDICFPCGLSSRDILRLEMGYSLYGNDIDEDANPFQANLGWVVDLHKEFFIGKKSLFQEYKKGMDKKLKGFIVLDKAIIRRGYEIFKNNTKIGYITSGGYSPVLERSIGLGYVDKNFSKLGNILNVKIRDNFYKLKVIKIPFIESKVKRRLITV